MRILGTPSSDEYNSNVFLFNNLSESCVANLFLTLSTQDKKKSKKSCSMRVNLLCRVRDNLFPLYFHVNSYLCRLMSAIISIYPPESCDLKSARNVNVSIYCINMRPV